MKGQCNPMRGPPVDYLAILNSLDAYREFGFLFCMHFPLQYP